MGEELVQCDHNGDMGCRGGLMDNAFTWVSQNGICSESSYPYTSGGGVTGTCKKSSCNPVATLTGHTDVPSKDETALKAAVSKQPVSVAIEADKSAFQFYAGGVLDNPACGTRLDHGVLIVGYGTDGDKDYWKVKNSWGASWGEKGYLRMVRNKNQCGIAQQPSYPTGVKATSSPGPSPPSPPTPPRPTGKPCPPSPSRFHFEDSRCGCRSDELAMSITNTAGSFCSPECKLDIYCPRDTPAGVTAKPQCVLEDNHKKYCALMCTSDASCGSNGSCKNVNKDFVGVCTYDDTSSDAKSITSTLQVQNTEEKDVLV